MSIIERLRNATFYKKQQLNLELISKEQGMINDLRELNFTDRLSYLEWRKQWLTAYHDAIKVVRTVKLKIKQAQREGTFTYPWNHGSGCASALHKERMEAAQWVMDLEAIRFNSRRKSGQQRKVMIEAKFGKEKVGI